MRHGPDHGLVPNHMGIMGADNGWWLDVLENGPASRFAGYFDIDWYAGTADLTGRVLLPVLGDHYGAVLENGELKLVFDAEQGSFSVSYYEHRFPVDPSEYPRILAHGLERLQARPGEEDAVLLEFQSLLTAFGHLPGRDVASPEAVAERTRDKEMHKRHLASLYIGSADVAQFVAENLAEFDGAATFDHMHELLQAQAYRLAFWRVAADEINRNRCAPSPADSAARPWWSRNRVGAGLQRISLCAAARLRGRWQSCRTLLPRMHRYVAYK